MLKTPIDWMTKQKANYLDLIFITGKNNILYMSCVTNVMISIFILSTFHSCQVTYHLVLHVASTFRSLSDAKDAAHYDDFEYRHKLLVDRLLPQGYKVNQLRNCFQKLYSRYTDLVAKYLKSVREMMNDSSPFLHNRLML